MPYVVKCSEFTTKLIKTKEAAEARLASIEAAGRCREEHLVVEVRR